MYTHQQKNELTTITKLSSDLSKQKNIKFGYLEKDCAQNNFYWRNTVLIEYPYKEELVCPEQYRNISII